LNTGRLSEGYRDPGLEPKVTRARTTERARDEQISRIASFAARWERHDRRRGKGLGKVQDRGLTRREGKARANRSQASCHLAARRVPARRAAVLRRQAGQD
jgi:hypothetical protein